MSTQYALYCTYMADASRLRAQAHEAEAMANACDPSKDDESREFDEAFYLNLAFDSRQQSLDWAEMAIEKLRGKAA